MNKDLSRLCFLSAAVALSTAACVTTTGSGSTSSGSGGSGGGSTAASSSSSSSSSGSSSGGSGGGAACQPATLVGAISVAGIWNMAAISPTTGAVTTLAPMASPMGIQQGGSAYDPATKHVYMIGEDAASQPTVLTIDALTGATLATVGLPDPHVGHPDVVGGGAIMILHQPAGSWQTATLNAATGAIASLAGLPPNGFSPDHGYDPGTDHLFEIGNLNGTGNVLTINATTGALMSNVVTADAHFGTMVVNGAGKLLGLHGTTGVWNVASLDPMTGAITDLAPITLTGTYGGMGTFDPCTNRIYMLTPDGLLTANGTSGAVISLVPLPGGQTNFVNIKAVW